ncbi:uncharacterized protein BO87DRAFT_107816 [Aspergillus neoniger CBS 115656]|uniref:Uncharacterized protein n=1 Tax=Aspergillus neoniger (strain CBS 115656) TaxID=1448310 RepID=A0A318YFD3_ASPNB|nr:hypothetical protein BO87DRAFT_107816 [Aspergillus neoniger CBS 115656]PYH32357.1 hypothetical protein BO87DRAFT_107816 [Aspergillus neoniger CBS 115656]
MLLPVGGFPSGWVAYSQGVCYLGCSWSSVGTARFAFLTFSTDQARDGQRYGAFWSSYGMVCVCVCVCACAIVSDRLYLTTMKSRISLMRTFFLLYCCGFSPFLHLRTVGPRFLCFCSDCMGI